VNEAASAIEVFPLTPQRWPGLEQLFGPNGAVAGCWCMWWRQTGREFEEHHGEANRRALRAITAEGRVPGLVAYRAGQPVGWVSVAPREEFGRLERSRTLERVDGQPVWSVVCFYIDRRHRRQGVGEALLRGAVEYALANGASIVEGYPVEPGSSGRVGSGAAFTGVVSMFAAAGFTEVARRGGRPIMRYVAGGTIDS
jgi:GNAT superfamily N-acetyltransferase